MHPEPTISLKAKLLAAAVAGVVALGLCELGARIAYETPPDPAREPAFLYERHPDLGYFHVPGQRGYLDDGLATTNAMGFRGTLPEVPKPPGRTRILAVGDSTTFGWGVDDGDTYVAQLEQRMRDARPGMDVDVVNGGVGAYDLKQTVRLLEHFLPVLEPDVVLVGVYWNDLPYQRVTPDGTSLGSGSGPAGPGVPGGADGKPFRIGNTPSRLNRILRSSRLLYVLRHAWLAVAADSGAASNQVNWELALLDGTQSPAIDAAWADIADTLTAICDLAKRHGFVPVFVTIPIRAQVEESHPRAAYQARVADIADALGILSIDPLPALRDRVGGPSLFIPFDRMHLSAAGNAVLGEAVFSALRDRPALRDARTER